MEFSLLSPLDQLHAPQIVQVHDAFDFPVRVDDDERGDLALFEDGERPGR